MIGESIAQRLELLGMATNDACVYVHLRLSGPSKAGRIAVECGLPRTHAYRALDRLVSLGFVTASLERPTIFTAEPPEVLFHTLLALADSRREAIAAAGAEVSAALASAKPVGSMASVRPRFNIIEGFEETSRRIGKMQSAAVREILLYLNVNAARRFLDGGDAFARWQHQAANGVRVRVIVARAANLHLDGQFEPTGLLEVRVSDEPRPAAFLVVDGSQLLCLAAGAAPTRSRTQPPVSVATDAEGLVSAFTVLFQHEWPRAALTTPLASTAPVQSLQ